MVKVNHCVTCVTYGVRLCVTYVTKCVTHVTTCVTHEHVDLLKFYYVLDSCHLENAPSDLKINRLRLRLTNF